MLRKYFARPAITIQFLTKLNCAGFIFEISYDDTKVEIKRDTSGDVRLEVIDGPRTFVANSINGILNIAATDGGHLKLIVPEKYTLNTVESEGITVIRGLIS